MPLFLGSSLLFLYAFGMHAHSELLSVEVTLCRPGLRIQALLEKGRNMTSFGVCTNVQVKPVENSWCSEQLTFSVGYMPRKKTLALCFQAPMLYCGERVGAGGEPRVDVAVDPLDGTTLTSQACSLCTLACRTRIYGRVL